MGTEAANELILVLDDEPSIAASIDRLLSGRGYQVLTVHTCDDALQLLQERTPNLLLTDVNLPCMNGFLFVQQLQRNGLLDRTPVVFVSAMARQKDRAAGLALGARGYVTKPFSVDELLTTVERALHPEPTTQSSQTFHCAQPAAQTRDDTEAVWTAVPGE